MRASFVRVGGVPHHVDVTGDGPVCVLSAGLGLAWCEWDPVVALLAPFRTVVRFDRPGLGLSAPARGAPTLAGEAGRIGGVLDALGLGGEAVTVVGHSLAGFHAEAFARLSPGRTAGLVLVDSSAEEGARARTACGRGLRVRAARVGGAVLGALGIPRALGPSARRLVGRRAPLPREFRALYGSARVWRAALVEYATYGDVARELAVLRGERGLPAGAPVRVLAAAPSSSPSPADRWTARQRSLADTLGAEFRLLAPAGHLLMRDRPHEVAEAILATG
ncbi:alpha/beta fold hydrolase [Streptomyces lasiicapitis]|uniref:Hydrolase (Alpha/beta hydrolase fold) n=1 Tax=Streptomyces lasiicapitis TaxID=1923961 RepID=A0ABQ2LZZ9_9ACTN|nr:alpha/beta hydrolase [Streptomyces lasiicapitis]GGO44952.1 putative hydrolase (alpha/beta hydrolase fold) [Streptomyces lasiicapitis]